MQKGIMRVNCKDSLDRTNLVCFWSAAYMLVKLGASIGVESVLYTDPTTVFNEFGTGQQLMQFLSPNVVTKLAELFLVCGDVCATLYTNSAAMHSNHIRDFIKPQCSSPLHKLTSKQSNAKIGIRRIIENRLNDDDRQRAIEMVLSQNHQTDLQSNLQLIPEAPSL
jgi:hypothetical protein